jgi:GT2 family glycosyltransferase
MSVSGGISVVVPVYNAAEELECCLRSLRSTVEPGTEVLVIDDASPDPAVRQVLKTWQKTCPAGWRIHSNENNLGFVGTANRGMRLTKGDVVLLNSDTVATPGWLDGMERCLESDRSIGTATPWTNNGEIASIPGFCKANPVPEEPDAVALAISRADRAGYPELPTAVGFCMAVSRRAIECVGLFDEALFGKGYGEENDFSMRVAQAGMRNVLCDDVYVVHLGGRSFGPLGLKPDERAMQSLLSRHPAYLEIVQEFIQADPLAPRRAEILAAIEREGVRLG